MSIFTPSPITYTNEQILNAKASHIKRLAILEYKKLLDIQTNGIKLIWNDPRFSPQEIVDALGADAVKIFQVHGILTDAINQIANVSGITPSITTPTNAFSIVDGVITVLDNPYTP